MKIAITGGTGFLGSHLVRKFLHDGHEVIVLKRCSSLLKRLEGVVSYVRMYDVEVGGIETMFQENPSLDAIIHTATAYGRREEQSAELFATNVDFPTALLTQAGQSNVKVFFNTDTVLPPNVNTYALTKKNFLEQGRIIAENSGVKFINVCLDQFYGPGDDESKFTSYIVRSCVRNIPEIMLTPGDQKRDFIYIDDVVEAYVALLEKTADIADLFQEYQVGTGMIISIKDFVELAKHITGAKTQMLYGAVPYRKNELMKTEINTAALISLGWMCRRNVRQGLEQMIENERRKFFFNGQ